MVSYQNAKIYKLLLPDGYYYIGCTCNELKTRKQKHKSKCITGNTMPLYLHIRFHSIDWNMINMVLYEIYPCQTKSELLLRESQLIRDHNDGFCLNSNVYTNIDGSTYESFNINRLIKHKNDRLINGDAVREKDRERYELKRKFVLLEKIICDCGVSHCKSHKEKHKLTKKHIAFMNLNL